MCNHKHNSLLHLPKTTVHVTSVELEQSQTSTNDNECSTVVSAYCNKESHGKMVLATAIVRFTDQNRVSY